MMVEQVLATLADDLKNFAQTEMIFGKQIEVDGATIIPVCRMAIGFGGGGGEGEGSGPEKNGSGKGMGGGGGGGVKLEPAALIIARKGEISVVGIQAKTTAFDKLIEMIPSAMDKFGAKKANGKSES